MAKSNRIKNATADVPDSRDWMYEPALIQLQESIDPPGNLHILDQLSEGACTGFAVTAAVNRLYMVADQDTRVSARMLYEMAKLNDEWPGEDYDGSSIRGAIHGWKNMGVCPESDWEFKARPAGSLTIKRAKAARSHTIGAYYRLKPVISDFHCAINEAEVIVASAQVHGGWDAPRRGRIEYRKRNQGGHAFAIVGYNEDGFWVQNSWGRSWGDGGLALWSYEDWIANVMDAWVFRLALPTPQIFGMRAESYKTASAEAGKTEKSAVPRSQIAGHFVHVDDGKYKEEGRYWSTAADVEQTARHVAESSKYKHLLVYVHGGLNSPKASARRITAMKDVFKQNGIYPFHVMYDTGIAEELKDLIMRKEGRAEGRVGGAISDVTDRFVEGLVRRPGTLLWDEMKQDAEDAFIPGGDGTDALNRFIANFARTGRRLKVHLVGHSTGAVVIAHLLKTLRRRDLKIWTCSLMAPACTVDLYHENYFPVLKRKTQISIGDMTIYNLKDKVEKDDNVAKVYRKSLLYLVSNAFEGDKKGKPLLGMQNFESDVKSVRKQPQFIYSDGVEGQRTRSDSHGGFDNDKYTMNHILRRILGKAPAVPFTKENLKY